MSWETQWAAVFLAFGFVSASRLVGTPSPKPRQKPKILAAQRYIFSVNALISIVPPGRKNDISSD